MKMVFLCLALFLTGCDDHGVNNHLPKQVAPNASLVFENNYGLVVYLVTIDNGKRFLVSENSICPVEDGVDLEKAIK